MKFNLKNRPRLHVLTVEEVARIPLLKQLDLANEQLEIYERWFEGFEKELRELSKASQLMDWLDKNHPKGEKWSDYGAKFVFTLDKLIKEILGES